MTPAPDDVSDLDLSAYVDDELAVGRRIEVEAYLSRHPSVAARVMADLRTRDELRLALAAEPSWASTATAEVARRLERALARDRLLERVRRVAALVVFVAAGWVAHAEFGALSVGAVVASPPPPGFVGDALMAHETARLRAGMDSQPGVPGYDPEEIRAATAVTVPALPDAWRVVDTQVFPSTYGPSVEMAIEAGELGRLSLFAVRPGAFDVRPVAVTAGKAANAAHWQIGEVAYALVGDGDGDDEALRRAADRLARSLY